MNAVFDSHAKEYDSEHQQAVSASGFGSAYFYEYKVKEVSRILAKYKIEHPKTILDFGCGVGNIDPYIRRYFPNAEIYGADVSRESINAAIEKNKEFNVAYGAFDPGGGLPFDISFDMVFVSGVFHHIPRAAHRGTFALLSSCMNPGALFFAFEHNPYNPATRAIFRKYDITIDKHANLIRPGYLKKLAEEQGIKVLRRNFTVFFPKALSPLLPLEKYMTNIPIGAQYYIYGQSEALHVLRGQGEALHVLRGIA